MGKYRKKPVVIEAVQITDDWFDNDPPNILHPLDHRIEYDPVNRCVNIKTLEGTMVGKIGDWIIAGVQGEVYPCRADIFEQTYDLVKGRGVMDKDKRIAELEAQLAQATTAVEQVSCKMLKLRHAGTNMLEGTVCAVSAIHDSTTVQFKQGQA